MCLSSNEFLSHLPSILEVTDIIRRQQQQQQNIVSHNSFFSVKFVKTWNE
jgi:hypothetical protein